MDQLAYLEALAQMNIGELVLANQGVELRGHAAELTAGMQFAVSSDTNVVASTDRNIEGQGTDTPGFGSFN